jgi:hypothetical protein
LKPATGTANSMREPCGGQLIAAPSPQHEPRKLAFSGAEGEHNSNAAGSLATSQSEKD